MSTFIYPLHDRLRIALTISRQLSDKIPMISAYRECTNTGLQEAKMAVEKAYGKDSVMDTKSLISLFGLDEKPEAPLTPLQKAIGHVEQHWKDLGFESLQAAVNVVAGNFS